MKKWYEYKTYFQCEEEQLDYYIARLREAIPHWLLKEETTVVEIPMDIELEEGYPLKEGDELLWHLKAHGASGWFGPVNIPDGVVPEPSKTWPPISDDGYYHIEFK